MTPSDSPAETPPLPAAKSSKIKYLWIIGVAAYLAFLAYVGWEDIRVALFDIHYKYLFALIATDIAILWFRVSKWHIALPGENDITRLAFLSKAGGNLTPGRLGEFSPLLIQKLHSPKTGAWILLDRLLEILDADRGLVKRDIGGPRREVNFCRTDARDAAQRTLNRRLAVLAGHALHLNRHVSHFEPSGIH